MELGTSPGQVVERGGGGSMTVPPYEVLQIGFKVIEVNYRSK